MRIRRFKSAAQNFTSGLREQYLHRPQGVAKNWARLADDGSRPALLVIAMFLLIYLTPVALVSQISPPDHRVGNSNLKVRTFCSKVNPGVAVAEISWSDGKSASARGVADASVQIVVTTVKDG